MAKVKIKFRRNSEDRYFVTYSGVRGKLPSYIAKYKVAGEQRFSAVPRDEFAKWVSSLREKGAVEVVEEIGLEAQAPAPDKKAGAPPPDRTSRQGKNGERQALPNGPIGTNAQDASVFEDWRVMLLKLMRARRSAIAVVGEPGVGKTHAVRWAAEQLGVPLLEVDGHQQMMPADFVGRTSIKQDARGVREVWRKGLLEKAHEMRAVLLVNEADALTADTLISILQSLAANPNEPGYALCGNGRRLDFSSYPCTPVVLTMNTTGRGEGIQYRREGQDAAILDRLTFIAAQQMEPAQVLRWVVYNGESLSDYQIDALALVAKRMRTKLSEHGFPFLLTNRDLMRIGQQYLMLKEEGTPTDSVIKEAFKREWTCRFPEDDRQALEELLKRI